MSESDIQKLIDKIQNSIEILRITMSDSAVVDKKTVLEEVGESIRELNIRC
jgi:hypothetical protein